MLPPFVDETLHVAVVGKEFSVAANCSLPPAGTVGEIGVSAIPCPDPTVTIALLDVMVPVEELEDVVDCWATAVMMTWPTCVPWPLEVVGTFAGAVYMPTNS